jgi:DNA polymerase III beta subunit-like protein
MIETEVVTGAALKLTLPRDEFIRQVAIVSRAASTRTTVQVLAGILLRAEEGKLHLAATDMELSLRTAMDAEVEADGAVIVPGKLLVDLAPGAFDCQNAGVGAAVGRSSFAIGGRKM